MPNTKVDLESEYNLSLEDVNATLNLCGLNLEQNEYTDEKIHSSFDIVRNFFANGQASDYSTAAELYKQFVSSLHQEAEPRGQKNPGIGKKVSNLTPNNDVQTNNLLNIAELLALASAQCNEKITLKQAAMILDSCGLPDTDFYTSEQGDLFLEACDLIKKENKTLEEVAAHFGVGGASKTNAVHSPQQLLELLGDSTVVLDDNLMDLINKITAKQTEGVNLNELVRQSYFMNLSRRISENQDDTDTFFADLESRVMDYVEGKNRARSLGTTWEWATNSLPPSSPKPMSLPEDSSNGANGD